MVIGYVEHEVCLFRMDRHIPEFGVENSRHVRAIRSAGWEFGGKPLSLAKHTYLTVWAIFHVRLNYFRLSFLTTAIGSSTLYRQDLVYKPYLWMQVAGLHSTKTSQKGIGTVHFSTLRALVLPPLPSGI